MTYIIRLKTPAAIVGLTVLKHSFLSNAVHRSASAKQKSIRNSAFCKILHALGHLLMIPLVFSAQMMRHVGNGHSF